MFFVGQIEEKIYQQMQQNHNQYLKLGSMLRAILFPLNSNIRNKNINKSQLLIS